MVLGSMLAKDISQLSVTNQDVSVVSALLTWNYNEVCRYLVAEVLPNGSTKTVELSIEMVLGLQPQFS